MHALDDIMLGLQASLDRHGVSVCPQMGVEVHRHVFDWRIRGRAHVSRIPGLGYVGRITVHLPHPCFAVWCPRAPAYLTGLLLHEVAHLERRARRPVVDGGDLHGPSWRSALEDVLRGSAWLRAGDYHLPPGLTATHEIDNWLAGLPWRPDVLQAALSVLRGDEDVE